MFWVCLRQKFPKLKNQICNLEVRLLIFYFEFGCCLLLLRCSVWIACGLPVCDLVCGLNPKSCGCFCSLFVLSLNCLCCLYGMVLFVLQVSSLYVGSSISRVYGCVSREFSKFRHTLIVNNCDLKSFDEKKLMVFLKNIS